MKLLTLRGAKPGPRLVLTAGVHGDEYEGIQTIFDLHRELDPAVMSGEWVALPVANPPALWAGTRTSPLDDGNLARMFPGDPSGTPTQVIAHEIDTQLFPGADFYVDLHSAGVTWQMPALVGYHEADPRARDAAFAMAMPVVWAHPSIAPGRTVSAAIARGIPSLYLEARGAGRIDPRDLFLYKRAIRNLMRHLGMLADALDTDAPPLVLRGDGNIDASIASAQRGFLTSAVEILQAVGEGELLGVLVDLQGRELERFHAPRAGVVALIHARPLVAPGEPLFLITGVAADAQQP